LPAYSRNVRNEIKKGGKIYFHDNGSRNAMMANFNSVDSRTDIGHLWKKFLISERMKDLSKIEKDMDCYFWRTTQQQQEIDYLKVNNLGIQAFEFTWNPNARVKFSKTFLNAYPEATRQVISRDNYLEFITGIA
jgi:predicted AAA+ superfamily ATPase